MKMKRNKDDNEVYFLGSDTQEKRTNRSSTRKWFLLTAVLVLVAVALVMLITWWNREQTPEYYFEPEMLAQETITIPQDANGAKADKGYVDLICDTINDVPLLIYTPYNATISLALGLPESRDTTLVFAAMAADIRKDNQQIVGDFVLAGEQLARGVAKSGYCAIVKDSLSVGMGNDTPLLQQAMDHKGSFFRQYALVTSGQLVENRPKNKSKRRALAIRNEQAIMVESVNNESFHDFSQALVDIGVAEAIYLVGGTAFGWYRDQQQVLHQYGKQLPQIPQQTSYIVWKANPTTR